MNRSLLAAAFYSTALFATPAIVCVAAMPVTAQAQESKMAERPFPVIRVTGEGSATLAPDMALVTLGILREAPTAREALDAHKVVAGDVATAMKAKGIEAKDLQTAGFSIQPRYFYPTPKSNGEQDPPKIVGYTVTSQLVVRIRDISVVGAVLDEAVTLGVNNDGSIQLTNDNPKDAITKARAAAMLDAVEKAKTLVEAAGAKLGGILEISESSSRPQPMPITRGKMMMGSAAPDAVPVEAGENAYSVNVQAVFEIAQ